VPSFAKFARDAPSSCRRHARGRRLRRGDRDRGHASPPPRRCARLAGAAARERALALLAVTVAAFSILVQVARGRLPIELSTSGLRYEAEAADDVAVAVAELQDQVDDLVATVDALADRLDRPQQRP
jgi:hypothetical protein